jgi:hypothetical protein
VQRQGLLQALDRIWDLLENVEPLCEVDDGFLICRSPHGDLCGLSTVQDRSAELATLRKVQREFWGHAYCLAVVGLLIP